MMKPEYIILNAPNSLTGIPLGFGNSFGSYYLYMCSNPSCKGIIYAILKNNKIVDMYPKKMPQVDKSVPTEVTRDFIEAAKCYDAGCFRAAASMCRRALQSSCVEKGAKDGKLTDQIIDLHERGFITTNLKDWAHEIRITGNVGAHPDNDGLKDVDRKEAEEIINFMEEYLKYLYVMPSKVEEKRAKRNEK